MSGGRSKREDKGTFLAAGHSFLLLTRALLQEGEFEEIPLRILSVVLVCLLLFWLTLEGGPTGCIVSSTG